MTVLAAYQHTPEGRAAVAAAVEEARLRDTDVVVMVAAGSGGPVTSVSDIAADLDTDDLRIRLAFPVRTDDLAGEVVDLATELDASLIVIGLRRRSPVGKALFGSTAQNILLNASVPVLTVRPR